jgi:hypothetical protein
MLERGVYLAPSQFEAMMPSLAHTPEPVEDDGRGGAGVRRLMASLLDEIRTPRGGRQPALERALLPARRRRRSSRAAARSRTCWGWR